MKTNKPDKTQQEKILEAMKSDVNRWWLPKDFVNLVGYEASARLSELAKDGLVESRKNGRFIERKLVTIKHN